jgi:endonuclease/exonuclease/phosphatase family metal-dependent hydrolase
MHANLFNQPEQLYFYWVKSNNTPMRKMMLFHLLISASLMLFGQRQDLSFTVACYNVENLFDLEDNPETEDEEFTPASAKAWDLEKYEKKLEDLAAVIKAIGQEELPAIIGLCEVENKKVLEDLIQTRALRRGHYGIVHYESPDARGIDNALLYRMQDFRVTSSRAIPVSFPFDPSGTTRDILYVKGTTRENEPFHMFVNHWSSRYGGVMETEPRRICCARALRREVDIVLNRDPGAKIIIMGDFNDEPTNRSVFEILMANNKRKNAGDRELYNLMYDMHNMEGQGTYNYRGRWNMLDQIMVSQSVINSPAGLHCHYGSGRILKQDFMLYLNGETRQQVPNRTYGGPSYYGGISDHLPVFVTLTKD